MNIVDYIKGHTRSLKKEEIKELLQKQSLGFLPTRKSYLFKKVYINGGVIFADLRPSQEWSSLNTLEYYDKKGVTYLRIYSFGFNPNDEEVELSKIYNSYYFAKWRYLGHKEQPPEYLIKKYEVKTGERCYFCHKRFLPRDIIIAHHTSYTHNRTIKVHRDCHGKIHSDKGKFKSLKPKAQVEKCIFS